MFGLSALVSLAIYAGLAVAALGAVYGFDHWRQGVGRDKQALEDAPVMAICEQFPAKGLFGGAKKADPADCAKSIRDELALGKQAVAGNQSLQADLAVLDGQRKACSGAVARLEKQGAAAAAASAARKPADDKTLATIAAEKQALIDALGRADTKAGTCEQRLARRDALWAGMAVQRQRDFPPSGAPQSGDVTIKVPK